MITDFKEKTGKIYNREKLTTMQMNITRKCNIACKHCHLESGPNRNEDISKEVIDKSLEVFNNFSFETLDITGGEARLSENLIYLINSFKPSAKKIMLRTNLVGLSGEEEFVDYLVENNIEVVASLPFYEEKRVDRQRGTGVFKESVEGLKLLNKKGYGRELNLFLVYNPNGAFVPSDQEGLEAIYRKKLKEEYGIDFTGLFAIANNPLGRFKDWLIRSGNYDSYMKKLEDGYNPSVLESLMCKDELSIDYDGSIYNCDFNLALGLKVGEIFDDRLDNLFSSEILTGNHCYGCTVGEGSSCGGSLE